MSRESIVRRNNVHRVGEGARTLLLAHGFGCDQTMWRYVLPRLRKRFRLVLFDYVDSGGSDLSAFDPRRYGTLEGYAGDIEVDLSPETVEVNKAVDDVLGLMKPLAEQGDIHCRKPPSEKLYVTADPTRLKQALLNLVSNAIKYNHKGGEVTVTVEPVRHNGQPRVRMAVSDTGPGIDPEHLSDLTSPFNRLQHEGSHIEGTGIGLTITRQVIEAMEGSLGMSSEPGLGSAFWIELPESQPEASGRAAATESRSAETGPTQQRQGTVLYIEDNPVNLKLVEQFVHRHGRARMVPAECPEKGIELATTIRPALILLDLSMPRKDGYQVLEILRAKPELSNTPIIAMTAYALPEDIRRGRAAGFDDYLTKPIKMAHFFGVLDQYLSDLS
ncbi:MAG: ATP-binding protein [Oleiphilaceae bacterium]|nr:ATP-binding protein [Oleiphilaceae bacterium]